MVTFNRFLFLDSDGSSCTCPHAGRSQKSVIFADREEDKLTRLLLFYLWEIFKLKISTDDEIDRLILPAWTCYMPSRQREFHWTSKLEERGCGIFNVFSLERAVSLRENWSEIVTKCSWLYGLCQVPHLSRIKSLTHFNETSPLGHLFGPFHHEISTQRDESGINFVLTEFLCLPQIHMLNSSLHSDCILRYDWWGDDKG